MEFSLIAPLLYGWVVNFQESHQCSNFVYVKPPSEETFLKCWHLFQMYCQCLTFKIYVIGSMLFFFSRGHPIVL
jgi:hypothetical protein